MNQSPVQNRNNDISSIQNLSARTLQMPDYSNILASNIQQQ